MRDPFICLWSDGELIWTNGDRFNHETHVFQQSTGFVDKNGVEIFEGDRLLCSAGRYSYIGDVVWYAGTIDVYGGEYAQVAAGFFFEPIFESDAEALGPRVFTKRRDYREDPAFKTYWGIGSEAAFENCGVCNYANALKSQVIGAIFEDVSDTIKRLP